MELSDHPGKMIHILAEYGWPLTAEQAETIVKLDTDGRLQRGRTWETWEQFLSAHQN